jgi:antitoxin component YwqK of YwqJK toxin-antitoxin module
MRLHTIFLGAGLAGLGIVGATHGAKGGAPAERTAYWASGDLRARTALEDGVEHGPAERWHRNGTIEGRGAYAHGRLHGAWRFWSADGVLDAERSGVYRDGQRVAPLDGDHDG